jgi:UDP-2,4-diacetamido-2,4,6-trideoxy-beta-L-altropyranose hydrolase
MSLSVTFRVDASREIGTGHVMRCLTLANALHERGASCQFICREHEGNLLDLIRSYGHQAIGLPYDESACKDEGKFCKANSPYASWLGAEEECDAQQTLVALDGAMADWMIVDHYAIGFRWEGVLRHACRHLMVIDDLADRNHDCDVLLDQNWFAEQTLTRYDNLVPSDCLKLLGPRYALLRPEYAQLRQTMHPRDGSVRHLLVFMGGGDPDNQTAKVLESLEQFDLTCFAVDVVMGVNHPNADGIALWVAEHPEATLHQGLPSLAGLMAEADLMIGAGGSTTWERMCLGLPSIVIGIAANQMTTNLALMQAGYITFVGHMDFVSSSDIAKAIRQCIDHPNLMQEQRLRMQELVNGSGAARLVNLLLNWGGQGGA